MAHRRLAGLEPGLLEEEVRASRALGGILGGPVEGFEQVDQALVPPVKHGRTAATLARGAQREEGQSWTGPGKRPGRQPALPEQLHLRLATAQLGLQGKKLER